MSDAIAESRLYPAGGIGASQIGALPPWNCSPWMTRADVYLSALGLAKPFKPSLCMRRGLLMEDYLRAAFTVATGKRLHVRWSPVVNSGCVLAHPDGWLQDDDTGLELKRVEENDSTWGDDPLQLPQQYYLQCQHSMVAANRKSWWFYAEIPHGGQGKAWLECRSVEFQAEPRIQAQIIETCKTAWAEIGELRALLEKDKDAAMARIAELAKADAEAVTHAAKIVYPYSPKPSVPAPAEVLADLREYATQQRDAKAAKDNMEQLKAKIAVAMKDATCWTGDFGKVSKRKDGALVFTATKGE